MSAPGYPPSLPSTEAAEAGAAEVSVNLDPRSPSLPNPEKNKVRDRRVSETVSHQNICILGLKMFITKDLGTRLISRIFQKSKVSKCVIVLT